MTEFEKWFEKEFPDVIYQENVQKYCIKGWKAALAMIKYEGVILDYELAGKIIKDELEE